MRKQGGSNYIHVDNVHCGCLTSSNFSAFSLQRAPDSFKYKLAIFFPKHLVSTQHQEVKPICHFC